MHEGYPARIARALCTVALLAASIQAAGLERVKYNHPGLVVDLGVGLWAWPLPMDYDGDGDLDLVVSCHDVPYNGTFLFENPGGKAKMPVFKLAVRLDRGMGNVRVSTVAGEPRVLGPATEYRDFRKNAFRDAVRLPAPPKVHKGRLRANQWSYADYDGDGKLDLIVGVGDWADYGWDNAFNAKGEWTRGPLHGYVYLLRNDGSTTKPKYEPAMKLEAGGKPLDVFGMPTPNLADFDGDGDLDILCGSFVDSLTYFQNTGTRTKPQYAAGRPLMHDGKPLTMDLCMIVPTAIDWDKDGDVDLVVGEEDGRVALVEHTGKVVDGVPVFLPQQQFQQQADCVKFGALATPVSVDWDGDGDEDIVSGNTAGTIGFIENLDGGNPPKWAKPVTLEADGKVIRVEAGPNGSIQGPCEAKWGYTTISVADWDHDGLPDIVANSIWGKVHWYRNAGARTAPKLSAARPIEVEWTGKPPKPVWNWWNPEGKALATQWRTTPVVIDLNKDGLNDLVMLDHEGYLALYERKRLDGKLVVLPPKRVFRDASSLAYGHRHLPAGIAAGALRLNNGTAGRSGRRKLCFADWDRDGKLDLLANSSNISVLRTEAVEDGIWTLRNMGTVDARRLAGHTTSPTICDWDKDGKPELLVGAEDGFFYHMETPYPIARRPVKKPAEHLVAAWDFEAGKGGPLADKATAGQMKDALEPLGGVKVQKGIAFVPGIKGCAYRAASSADLELGDELTLWIRFRIEKANRTYVSLVDKRRFSKPEERSYALYLPPDRKTPTLFGVGGQVSATGTGSGSVAMANARETLPVGKWREVAMIVSRRTHFLSVRWLGSSKENPTAAGEFVQVAGPVSSPALTRIFRSKQPLLIGNDVGLGAHEVVLEIDEVRLYDRALAASELAAIEPGELSK